LPEGFTVNPSQANGLQACSEAQIGYLGKSPDPSGEYENFTGTAPECPQASKVGTVELETPDLASEVCKGEARPLTECTAESEREKVPLTGSIYVARQFENPFGSLLAIYIVVDDERTGVVVKLPGELKSTEYRTDHRHVRRYPPVPLQRTTHPLLRWQQGRAEDPRYLRLVHPGLRTRTMVRRSWGSPERYVQPAVRDQSGCGRRYVRGRRGAGAEQPVL